jgi:hypothetical protein
MSAVFHAFNSVAWIHARTIGNYVWNRLPGAAVARCGWYDCWTLRAVLYNQFTHLDNDKNDEKRGYAAITRLALLKEEILSFRSCAASLLLESGDVIFLKGRALNHYVNE